MIEQVCNLLKTRITGDWTDRVAGHTERVSVKLGDGKLVHFPFEHDVTTCDVTSAVIPDNKYKSVVWFTSLSGISESQQSYSTRVRVMVWLDINKLASGDRTITSGVMADVIGKMKNGASTQGNLHISKVSFASMPNKSLTIFNQYDFNTQKANWWFGDYDYFAIDFDVQFSMDCTVELNEKSC